MAQRIVRPATAFSLTSSSKKRPRQHREAHLDFIRDLPCLISGRRPVDAAHIRYGDTQYGKAHAGAAEKPSDQWCVPLHHDIHMQQHANGNEASWWESQGIDPLEVAGRLWLVSGDIEAGELVIAAYRRST